MTNQATTYRMTTLGCRTNHAEQREMEAVLEARGLRSVHGSEPAALEVVHTCSVTARAAAKSRQAIRRAARRHDTARPKVIVTGCFVGTDEATATQLAGEQGPGTAIGHASSDGLTMIERFASEVDHWLGETPPPDRSERPTREPLTLPIIELPTRPAHHARAEIRIQDGCDAHCTFCIIPTLRPTLRSKTIPDVVTEARRLVELGHREIVLSGIFIGAYGHPTALRRRQVPATSPTLPDLLDAVAQVDGLERLRISSMEPMDVTDELLDAMVANAEVVVPHLHLPLQSGSDRVLHRMNRQYTVAAYLDMIDRLNESLLTDGLPAAITTDIICGFPGETDEDFQDTVAIARRVGYLHMHVFPFSPRSGTAAARWRDRFVAPGVIRDRVQALIELETDPDEGLAVRYRRQLVGRQVRTIIEQPDHDRPGRWLGRCDHYEQLSVAGELQRGQMVTVQVDRLDGSDTLATITEQTRSLPLLARRTPALEIDP
ncbi:MAG: MiaB/RimO family radical SAM methylthiotransferase [Phycisphaerales bacterium]|nr:MiaB/RimO family radical SAM methylthiotransferase [Phycisphaerales bacterium]